MIMKLVKGNSVGIDPGYNGAIVLLSVYDVDKSRTDINVIEIKDYTSKVKNRKTKLIDFDGLIEELNSFLEVSNIAVIERVKAMPRDGGTSAFNFGYISGVLNGLVHQYNNLQYLRDDFDRDYIVDVLTPTPQAWKSFAGLPTGADKMKSVELATKLFPEEQNQFYGPRGGPKYDIAEAALLALYGLNKKEL